MGDGFGTKVGKGIRSVIEKRQSIFYFEYPCHSPAEKRWFMMRVNPFQLNGTNYFYISLTNSSAAHSWPCHFITPDGLIAKKLRANESGLLISEVDIGVKYYDASKPFRMDAIKGKLNSGEIVEDERSKKRTIH